MDDSAFAVRLAKSGAEVERELEELLGLEPRPGEPARPERLIRRCAMRARRRQTAAALPDDRDCAGAWRTGAAPRRAGAAIECVHGYSLIHDDLPAMDDDDCVAAGPRFIARMTKRPRSSRATRC